MNIDEDAVYELLRSSRERIRHCKKLEKDSATALLATRQLVRETMAILHDGRHSAILKFSHPQNALGIDPSPDPV